MWYNLSDLHTTMKQHFSNHAHLWKKTAIIALVLLQAASFAMNGNGFSWSYPLKEVSKDSACRKTKWSELSEDCKQALPIIKGANYANYKDNPLYTSIYTTMWGAPYDNGWAIGMGAHEGVDIVSSEGTPVYSVEDGVVIRARAQAGYGNVVMIKHTMPNKKVVFSIYGHLKDITVPENTPVKEGDMIGTVGNEGFSFGNHLLWDINITPTNTYAFWGCPEYGNGTTFNVIANIVNGGLCRSYLYERTTDPIAWIESQGGTIALQHNTTAAPLITWTSTRSTNTISNTTTRKRMPMVALEPTLTQTATPTVNPTKSTTTNTSTTVVQKSLATRILTTSEIPKNTVAIATSNTTKTTTAKWAVMEVADVAKLGEQFLDKYNVNIAPGFSNNMDVGQTTSLVIQVTDKATGKPYVGMLPKEISLVLSENILTLSPQIIRLTNSDGKALVLISADRIGSTSLVVSYNMKTLSKMTVTVK